MNFSVATNWDEKLISLISHPEITEMFGKLRSDFAGGGRTSATLPFVTRKAVRQYINKLRKEGKQFNYLLNSSCLGNDEFTISGQNKLRGILDWLAEMNVARITVAIPFLLEFIKKQYPQFKIQISSSAVVDSIRKVKQWEDLGADSITLPRSIYREFKILEGIRKNTKCELQLIANSLCIYDCILCLSDMNVGSHASRSCSFSMEPSEHSKEPSRFFEKPRYLSKKPLSLRKSFLGTNYYVMSCGYKMFSDPAEFMRASWIRPEDVCYYEKIGIDSLKLLDRMSPTEQLSLAISSYTKRSYKGNLLRILLPFHLVDEPDFFAELICSAIYIDNKSLDGFLKYFLNNSCILKNCKDCNYCQRIAKKVIRIDEKFLRFLVRECDRVIFDKLKQSEAKSVLKRIKK